MWVVAVMSPFEKIFLIFVPLNSSYDDLYTRYQLGASIYRNIALICRYYSVNQSGVF